MEDFPNSHETTHLPLKIESKEQVYQDRNQKIQRIVAHFDDFDKEYFVSDHGKRAALLAVYNDKVLLVRQYRLIINDLSYEIPGGRIDENETPEDAAIRECFEETSVKCSNLEPLLSFHPSLDIWKNHTRIFFSEKFCQLPVDRSDRHLWTPIEHCIEMIFSGTIVDSLSILALLTYFTKLNKS